MFTEADNYAGLLSERRLYYAVFVVFGFFPPIADYLRALAGGYDMVDNASEVWLPFAQSVLAGGAPYLSQWDNKPPLFQFVNLFAAWTGNYRLVFTLLIAGANLLAAVCLYKLCEQYFSGKVGFVAALFYLSGGLLFNLAQSINPRQFAVLLLLLSFLASAGWSRGVLVAAAGLFTQYSIFAIPALLYDDYRMERLTLKRFLVFNAAGLATLIGVFGVVAIVWSPDSAVTGFRYSFLEAGQYVSGQAAGADTAWANPDRWLLKTYTQASYLAVVTVFTLGVAMNRILRQQEGSGFAATALVAGCLLFLPTMARINVWYYLPALPFFSVAAAAGLSRFFGPDAA